MLKYTHQAPENQETLKRTAPSVQGKQILEYISARIYSEIRMKKHIHCAAMNNVSYIAEKQARRERWLLSNKS
jgi:hypothetical protein